MARAIEQGMTERTSISVSDKLADELYDRKRRGDTYEDVIWRLIEENDESEVPA
jgi:predicted CopG family antitoxin